MPKQRLRSFIPTSFKTSSGDSRYISDRIIIIHTFILPLICLSRSWEIEVPAFFTHTTATNTYRHYTDNKEYHAMHTLGKMPKIMHICRSVLQFTYSRREVQSLISSFFTLHLFSAVETLVVLLLFGWNIYFFWAYLLVVLLSQDVIKLEF